MAAQAWEHPVVKWVMGVAQVAFISFICWVGNNIGSSVTAFSGKLDRVASSIAEIAAKQVMQERDAAALQQRVGKVEGKAEVLEKTVDRMTFRIEQLEKESSHGR